jgi:hypothetical protein
MLTRLVRLTTVARMLGVDKRTCESWLSARGCSTIRSPLAGRHATNSPRYVSLEGAVALVDALLPGKANRLALARSRAWLRAQAARLEESTRNLEHQIGGTRSEAPTPKPPL